MIRSRSSCFPVARLAVAAQAGDETVELLKIVLVGSDGVTGRAFLNRHEVQKVANVIVHCALDMC